ncbi:sushi, von Willebrand factor type A, EGF and pentraxin domain-containing protein 1-like isoform X2 [Sycon ciliatum]|uniref:sushi, von Willebrand factor type A, EGF and pentraxin domain-containing protein 1-like isoform X2 n=1 Tax=Sycon ciliatum TaxID=27933 RepID=UPI0031F6CC39
MSDITGSCAQSYIAHITTQLNRSISIWVSDGSGGVTCYPTVTPCPAGDVVMCRNTRGDAVSPPSMHCGTALSPVANGNVIYPSGDVFPSQAFLVCDLGYTKSSTNWYADCGTGGSWATTSGPQTCNVNNCPTPAITNGMVTGSAPVFNVACNANFGIVGNPTVTCTSGNTTTTVPTCEPICPILNISNASYSTANQLVGTNVNVTCNSGFEMFGPQTVTCQASQLWTTIPECEAIVCKTLPTINNGGATASSMTKYGVLHIHCNTGYTLSGMATSKCLSNGSWESPIASCTEMTCTSPPSTPANGAVTTGTNTLSSVLQYSCNEGYQLSGTSYTVCQADGSWSTANPMCTQITCPMATPPPASGTVSSSANTYLSSRQYSCMTGYTLTGSTDTVCLSNGKWSGTQPICSRIMCSAPIPQVTDGGVEMGGTTYLTVRGFFCNPDYALSGSRYTVCQADGTWSTATPNCTENTCRTLMTPMNGYVYMDDRTFGSKASFSCIAGYRLTGVSSVTCLTSQTWSAPSPTCTNITCPSPPTALTNGAVSSGTNTFSSVRQYSCMEGYQLSGTSYTICQADGSWSTANPMCTQITCPMTTPPPASGTVSSSANTYLSSRQYSCMTGYTLTGSTDTVCLSNGKWSGTQPTCSKNTCPTLLAPINGYVYMDGTAFGSKTSFGCNVGYELTGVSSVRCLTNQTWSAISPTCTKITCPVLATPPNALVSPGTVDFQAQRTFSCSDGYTLSGDSQLVCLLNGSWSAPLPNCSKSAECAPLNVGNATVSSGPYRVNSIVNITCNAGFELSGNAMVICLDSQKWSSIPICNRVPECPLLIVNNAVVSGVSTRVNSIRNITCNVGFELSGHSLVTCLPSGDWTTFPVCNRVPQCPLLTVSNGIVSGGSNTVNSIRSITCNANFDLSGNSMVICLATAAWSSTPVCNPRPCPGPPNTNNGVVMSDPSASYAYGDSVYVQCNTGHSGSDNITCTADGTWSTLTCSASDCGAIQKPVNGMFFTNGTTYGSMASFTCNIGYNLAGSSSITCPESGVWSATFPSCDRVVCNTLVKPTLGTVRIAANDYLSTATYSCNDGYVLSGDAVTTCLLTGLWSTSPPTCQRIPTCAVLTIANGAFSEQQTQRLSAVANVTCNEGYKINGSRSVVCLESGKWSDTPHCMDSTMACPELLAPANGLIDNGSLDLGTGRKYSCSAGYTTMDPTTTFCLKGGHWSEPAPACALPCTSEQTTPSSTSSNIVAGVIGFLAGLIIPAALIIIYLARYRGKAKTITITESENAKPSAIFVSQLTENDAYEMTSTGVETTPEPEYATMSTA